MTLLTSDAKIQYNGDGAQTAFPIAFPFFDAAHIQAVRRESSGVEGVLTQGSDYTVGGGGGGTGTLTATAAPASGVTLTIRRVVPLTQDTDYPEGGAFPASSHENALDRLTMMTQQLDEGGGRALKFPVTDAESLSGEVPSSVDRAGRILGFDTAGDPKASAATLASIEAAVAGIQATGTGFSDYQFAGDGAATAFVMVGVEVVTRLQCLVSIDGLMQSVANYSTAIAGGDTTLTFATAPPNGAEINVLVAAIDIATLESTIAPTALGQTIITRALASEIRADLDAQQTLIGTVLTANHDILHRDGAGALARLALGAAETLLGSDGAALAYRRPRLDRSFLAGLGLANNGADADHDIDIAAGECRDGANAADMVLAAALTKRIDAGWAVGAGMGGLDTGVVALDSWYHLWLIRRSDTGVVDALFSLSATAPTMPGGYDAKRRLGAVLTDGAANIIGFIQAGDYFWWSSPVEDFAVNNPGTARVLRTMSTPGGLKLPAILTAFQVDAASQENEFIFTDPDGADIAPANGLAHIVITQLGGESDEDSSGTVMVMTDASSRVGTRATFSGASTQIRGATYGWIDRRGRDD